MSRCTKCPAENIELVHKITVPVPGKSLYEDAVSRGEFVGTFKQYQDYMRGSIEVDPETGNWVINGVDTGIKAEGVTPEIATTTVKGLVNQSSAESAITTADATDETEAIALVNELKAKINAILASDRTSGQRAT